MNRKLVGLMYMALVVAELPWTVLSVQELFGNPRLDDHHVLTPWTLYIYDVLPVVLAYARFMTITICAGIAWLAVVSKHVVHTPAGVC